MRIAFSMKYNELTTEQKQVLAAAYLSEKNTANNEGTSYAELADPFAFVTPEEVADNYEGYDFTIDDLIENFGYSYQDDPDYDPTTDTGRTRIAFRVWDDGEVIALMPDEICNPDGDITSYEHIGQHGPASRDLVTDLLPATPDEYKSLYDELTARGYRIDLYDEPTDPDDCKQFYVYAGYYENYITTKPMNAPRVFRKVFATIEDAIEHCFYDLEDPIVICKDCVKHWPLFYWCDPRDFTNYDPETDTVQNWEFDSIAGEYKLEKAA